MGSWNRIWIFFVIVAVGLVLSWGQVGKKVQVSLLEDATEPLFTEPDCQPLLLPCAATGRELGLVLGPMSGARLLLKATSVDARLEGVFLETRAARSAVRLLPVVELGGGEWQVDLPTKRDPKASDLRVRFATPAVTAIYPLR